MLRPAPGVFVASVVLFGASFGAGGLRGPDPAVQPFEPSALYSEFARACADTHDDACTVGVASLVATHAARLASVPTGPPAPASWIAAAADLSGHTPAEVAPPRGSIAELVLALYDEAGFVVDDGLARQVAREAAQLDPASRAAVRSLLADVLAASRAAHAAVARSDLAPLADDPATAARLATFVGSAPPGQTPPPWAARWRSVEAAIAGVDRPLLLAAGAALARAVADAADPRLETATLDLPFILIGAAGDSIHTADYIILVDQGGDDQYLNHAGAGLFAGAGVGLAVDQGAGADVYTAAAQAQGFGLGGVGILYDDGGSDRYSVAQFGQGAGAAGIGMLYDAGSSDDVYFSGFYEGSISTKAATLGGVGILVDEGGDDRYRQDALDGFAYGAATGVAILADRGVGDDVYESRASDIALLGIALGNFSGPVQVSAEVAGTAVLLDEGGADVYDCGERVRQGCQGAAGAGSIALLLERGGDDLYTMGVSFSEDVSAALSEDLPPTGVGIFSMGQGGGYGVSAPGGIGILHDGDGADSYVAEKWAQGWGGFGLGLFFDDGADSDVHATAAPTLGSRSDGGTWFDGTSGFGVDR